ncbi:hypothetical protein GCM10007422_18200 [Pedobacter zeae]|uniref:Tail specific protease domain-containing protein n=1 Tax=Pedobacter zeae TaxID=1737356 RepID=A0ABQ1XU93_9SPHI|nr:hypothetical protein GCM10007422_18200 [Pedobacter zeae]
MKFVIERVKKNYIGYNDKTDASNKKKFEIFTDSLLNEAGKAATYQCLPVIRKWLSFFKDKHLSIAYNDSHYSKEQIRDYYAHEERTDWTDSLFMAYLDNSKRSLDNIEGVWKDHTASYQIGIVKDKKSKGEFIGFVIKADGARWMPQQVKLRIVKTGKGYFLKYFRAVDHSLAALSFQKINDTIALGDGVVTSKWYKNATIQPKPLAQNSDQESGPKFRFLDDQTGLLQMPSYASLDYVAEVDSILKNKVKETAKLDHLIIDLRNNYGGSVLMYDKIIPYVYTGPILTEGGIVLATEENIRDYYSNIPSNVSDSMRKVFEKNLNTLKSHLNELYPLYPIDTIKFSKIMNYPKSVSVIMNRNTASAAELFILQAKQSSKVKLYGTNSSGAIDYLEVVRTKLPCGFYSLGYPACKSMRLPGYPLDNIGIKPDVEIPVGISDWIEFVKAYSIKKGQ